MIWIKQIFKLTRYFIVVYQYQTEGGGTGQGQCTAKVSNGQYFSVDEIAKVVEPNVGGKIIRFLILNAIELNKRDFDFHVETTSLKFIGHEG